MADKKPDDGLRKLARAEEAKRATADYNAASAAVDANMLRLRALRLEREAAEAKAAAERPAPAKKAASGKAKTAKAGIAAPGKLADWLKDQQNSGRTS